MPICLLICIKSYGVFQAYYEAVLLPDKSPATIAWIGSCQIFFLFSMSVIVSPLIDKGYFRLCFNGGSFLMFVSILITSWCHNFWQLLLVQGILTGIGMGMAFGGGILVLQSYFTTHLGIAAGLTSAGGPVGMCFSVLDRTPFWLILIEKKVAWYTQQSPSISSSKSALPIPGEVCQARLPL